MKVEFTEKALKALKRLDNYQQRLIIGRVQKNLEDCEDPRQHGKALTADKKGYWRYRVGAYRLIAEMDMPADCV